MVRKVVVTGASGHIGYHVARQLVEAGHAVHLVVRSRNANVERLAQSGAIVHTVNLADVSDLHPVLEGAEALFHLAAENTTDTSDEARVVANTFGLTKTVLDAAVAAGVPTILYTSSVVALGRSPRRDLLLDERSRAERPESPYVKGKLLAERYCDDLMQRVGVDLRRLYPSWVVGSDDLKGTPPHRVIAAAVKKGQAFAFAGGISVAEVEEVARAHVQAWLRGTQGAQYVLAGENLTFQQFYSLLAQYSGHKAPKVQAPKWALYAASLVLKILLGRKSPADPTYIKAVVGTWSWYDSSKAIRELGYAIPPAERVIRAAVQGARKAALGLTGLAPRHQPGLAREQYADDDVLLITGFPGWLGNRMVDVFLNGDRFGRNAIARRVRLLVQPRFAGLVSLPENFEVVYGDITDKASLAPAVRGVNAVYHLAGVIYPPKISAFDAVNVQGTRNLVDACIEAGVRRVLFMGTDSICGFGRFTEQTPATPYKSYGRSKFLAEQYILDKTAEGVIDGTSLRGFWFFGPFMPERNLGFFKMFAWPRQLVFGNGRNVRSVSHVDNVIAAFRLAEKRRETIGRWYWIGDAEGGRSVDDIYRLVATALGRPYRPVHIPNFVCDLMGLADRALALTGRLNPTIHAAGKFHQDIAGDSAAAARDFGYRADVGFAEIAQELPALVNRQP